MRSTFFGIELARRALSAQQRALDVASHNIANANRPEYSRQRAEMVATAPYAPPGMAPAGAAGQVGTGVWVREIARLRDAFLDDRIRAQNRLGGEWQVRRDVLEQVERIFNEPSENGIRVALDNLWKALQDLSVTPDSLAAREVVVQRGRVLADAVRSVFKQLERLRVDLDRTVELKVDRLNSLATRLAELNGLIAKTVASAQNPNDLLDERDAILEEMARLASITVTERPSEQVAVSVGGLTLVDAEIPHKLVMGPEASPNRTIRWGSDTGPEVTFDGGEIRAYLQLRGTISGGPATATGEIPSWMRELDRWVDNVFTVFNRQHGSGYALDGSTSGIPFFAVENPGSLSPLLDQDDDGWVVDDLRVDGGVEADPSRVAAASAPGSPGDGANANELAGVLRTRPIDGLGSATAPDSFARLVGRIGVSTQEAQTMFENQEVLLNHLKTLRDSVSGVSLDEEMADLVRFEHAYGAAARAMTAMDEVLDTLINRTGSVGR